MKKSMLDVLVAVEVVKSLVKDLHYRTNGEYSYAIHLLADRVFFGSNEDDIKELYYLGYKAELPPTEEEIHKIASEEAKKFKVKGDVSNKELMQAVIDASAAGVAVIEDVKKEEEIPGGVHSVLDYVSEVMLRTKGLVWMALRTPEPAKSNKSGDNPKNLVLFLGGEE